jgi:hypothetical protein
MPRFRYLNEDWEAESIGMAHGAGAGPEVQVTHYGVKFRCLSNASKGPYYGDISKPDPGQVSEEELKRALERGITTAIHDQIATVIRHPRRVGTGTYKSDYREYWFYIDDGDAGVVAVEREVFEAFPGNSNAQGLLRLSQLAGLLGRDRKVLITAGELRVDRLHGA